MAGPKEMIGAHKDRQAPKMETLQRDMDSINEKVSENVKNMKQSAMEYETAYRKYDFLQDLPDFHRRFSADMPDMAIADINTILGAAIKVGSRKGILEQWYMFGNEKQDVKKTAQVLKTLKDLFEKHKELLKKQKDTREKIIGKSGHRLAERLEHITKAKETKTLLEKNPVFSNISETYDTIAEGFINNPEYVRLYTNPEGKRDDRLAREHKHLFLSMIAAQTNNFKESFPLGKKFGSDPEKNKEKFPFIYNEWLKKKTGKENISEEINRRSDTYNKALKKAGAENMAGFIKEVENKINDLNSRLKKTFPNNEDGLRIKNPFTNISNPDNVRYAINIKGAIVHLHDDFSRRIEAIQKIDSNSNLIVILKNIQSEITSRKDVADTFQDFEIAKSQEKNALENFTKENLEKDRRWLLQTMMKKFVKAIQIVDDPNNSQSALNQYSLHSGARRDVIALIYQNGVARFNPKGEYIDDLSPEYRIMLTKLSASPAYSRMASARYMTPEQRKFQYFAAISNSIRIQTDYMQKEILPVLKGPKIQKLINIITNTDTPAEQVTDAIKKIQEYTPAKITADNAKDVVSIEEERLTKWTASADEIDSLIQKGDRQALFDYMRVFKEKNKKEEDTKMLGLIEDYEKYSDKAYLTYDQLELTEKSRTDVLSRMGIRTEALYKGYLNYIKKDPDMHVDRWDYHYETADGRKKLIELFQNILPDSKTMKGKKDFLAVFGTMENINMGATKSRTWGEGQTAALEIYQSLKITVKNKENISIASKTGNNAAIEKLQGSTFADKITDGFKGVLDMAIGPGQSIANRAAGIAMLYFAYRLIRKGIKGGPMGKLLRVGGIAVAAELAMKHITGAGVLDRLAITGAADKLKGTWESVLMDRFDKSDLKDIESHEHAAALTELRYKNVRMDKLLEWYENTDEAGQPRPGERDRFHRLGIDPYNIVRGYIDTDKSERRSRVIIKKTLKNFFGYVANKEDKKDPRDGMEMVKERWITAVNNPDYDLGKMKHSDIDIHKTLIQQYRERPRSLTWSEVMAAEITPDDVAKVQREGLVQRTFDAGFAVAHTIQDWSLDKIYSAGKAYEDFSKNLDERYAPAFWDSLDGLYKGAGRKITLLGDKIKVTYDANKELVIRAAKEHGQLVLEGIKLPFKLLWKVDQLLIPWALTKAKQIDAFMFQPANETLKTDNLTSKDIMDPDVLKKAKEITDLADPKINPNYEALGVYQPHFFRAWQNKETGKEASEAWNETPDKIGYYITEIGNKEAGITAEDDAGNKMAKMKSGSWDKAVQYYKNKSQSEEDINLLMYPIHTKRNKSGDKMYIFWRMPLKGSDEYTLKKEGKWTDYMDPEKHKHYIPFKIDPKKSLYDNLTSAFTPKWPLLREIGAYSTMAGAQFIRFLHFITRIGGDAVNQLPFLDKSEKEAVTKWTRLDEAQLQAIDELMGSAAYDHMAISKLYKNKKNADQYKKAWEIAKETKEAKLDLSKIQGRQNE